uniref:Facilitated trehalose transporter Tret1 n=1 Tax=Cacopsylla melanoneura TaxID=428564 RepID=A0A8D8Z2U3_9HEMI
MNSEKRPSCTSAEFNSLVTNGKSKRRQYITACVVNIITFAFGNVNGWPSPAQSKLQSPNPPIGDRPLTDEEISWLGSIVFMGGVIGALIWSQVADRLGRKAAGYMTALPFVLSWAMMIFATNYWSLFIARFLIGIGTTGVLINVPLIVSEMADKDLRGPLGTCLILFLNGGYLFSYVIGAFATFNQLNICCFFVPIIFLVTFYWIPESPSFLISQNRMEEARDALFWYRGDDSEVTEIELKFLVSQYDLKPQVNLSALFADRGVFKGFTIGFILIMGQQLTGANIVLTYTASIFKESGSKLEPNICTIIIGTLQFIASILSCIVVNKAGRKALLLVTYLGIAFTLSVMGFCFYLIAIGTDISSFSYIPIIALSLYVCCNSMGAGPVPYILFGEILPGYIQNLAISVSFFFGIFGAFLVVKTYPTLNALCGRHGTFYFYAICNLTIYFYTMIFVPETKGRSVRSILRELKGTPKAKEVESTSSSTMDIVDITKSTVSLTPS